MKLRRQTQNNQSINLTNPTPASLFLDPFYDRVEVTEINSEHVTAVSGHLVELSYTVAPPNTDREYLNIGTFQRACSF